MCFAKQSAAKPAEPVNRQSRRKKNIYIMKLSEGGKYIMAYDHGAFRVSNLEKAIAFYTGKLGFRQLFLVDSEAFGERGVFLEYHGARLELIETIGVSYQPAAPARPYCPHLCFEADDMDEVLAVLRKHGIPILDGPNEIPGSEQWIYFTDPDGNVLEYIVWLDKHKSETP